MFYSVFLRQGVLLGVLIAFNEKVRVTSVRISRRAGSFRLLFRVRLCFYWVRPVPVWLCLLFFHSVSLGSRFIPSLGRVSDASSGFVSPEPPLAINRRRWKADAGGHGTVESRFLSTAPVRTLCGRLWKLEKANHNRDAPLEQHRPCTGACRGTRNQDDGLSFPQKK